MTAAGEDLRHHAASTTRCAAVDAGADSLGFNFHPREPALRRRRGGARRSPRRCRAACCCVGVFVDAPRDEVARDRRRASGSTRCSSTATRPPAYCARLGCADDQGAPRPRAGDDAGARRRAYPVDFHPARRLRRRARRAARARASTRRAARGPRRASGCSSPAGCAPRHVADAVRAAAAVRRRRRLRRRARRRASRTLRRSRTFIRRAKAA